LLFGELAVLGYQIRLKTREIGEDKRRQKGAFLGVLHTRKDR
jgi:hypothetical protein